MLNTKKEKSKAHLIRDFRKTDLAVTGAEATDKPTVKADRQVVVQLDADRNKIAD